MEAGYKRPFLRGTSKDPGVSASLSIKEWRKEFSISSIFKNPQVIGAQPIGDWGFRSWIWWLWTNLQNWCSARGLQGRTCEVPVTLDNTIGKGVRGLDPGCSPLKEGKPQSHVGFLWGQCSQGDHEADAWLMVICSHTIPFSGSGLLLTSYTISDKEG